MTVAGADDAAYSETKFLAVKHLLERFRGRELSTDLAPKWTRKVTDVRTWFEFEVSSLLMDHATLVEHRASLGGSWSRQRHALERLTPEERRRYDNLRFSRVGDQVRLEQKRVRIG